MATSPLYYGGIVWTAAVASVLTADEPAKAAGTTVGIGVHGFSLSNGRLTCTASAGRMYKVDVTASVTKGSGSSSDSSHMIYRNGVSVGPSIGRTIANATDEGAFALSAFVTLKKGDYIELWHSTSTGDDLTISAGSTLLVTVAG